MHLTSIAWPHTVCSEMLRVRSPCDRCKRVVVALRSVVAQRERLGRAFFSKEDVKVLNKGFPLPVGRDLPSITIPIFLLGRPSLLPLLWRQLNHSVVDVIAIFLRRIILGGPAELTLHSRSKLLARVAG